MNARLFFFGFIVVTVCSLFAWYHFVNRGAHFNQTITIVIKDGVYQPAFIKVPAGEQINLVFLREDKAACASSVFFPGLQLSYELPLYQAVHVTLPPQKASELDFTCLGGIYRGKLVVD